MMRKINKSFVLLIVLMSLLGIGGCNKTGKDTESVGASRPVSQSIIESSENEGDLRETSIETGTSILETPTEETESLHSFSLGTRINMLEYNADREDWFPIRSEEIRIIEGDNAYNIETICEPDPSLQRSEIIQRLYLIDNGKLVPFALADDGEKAYYHDITIKAAEQYNQIIVFSSDDIPASKGYLTVLCVFNPDACPEKSKNIYTASNMKLIRYTNPFGGEAQKEEVHEREYIELKDEWLSDGYGIQVCTALQEEDGYKMSFNYLYDDIEASKDAEKLYLQINLGESTEGDFYVGLLCDGEFVKLDGQKEFLTFEMDWGKHTLQYPLPETAYPEQGMHYYQVVIIPQYGTDEYSILLSQRFRILVPS